MIAPSSEAVTFIEALDAAQGKAVAPHVRACLDAFKQCKQIVDTEARLIPGRTRAEVKALYRLIRLSAREALTISTHGQLVVACIRVSKPVAIMSWLSLVAPEMTRKRTPAQEREQAIALLGDCWLALSEWVLDWNRKQIRRVA